MDKLSIALDIISKRAFEQRSEGEVPTFLGIRGMLALMYDRIRAFSKDKEDNSEYVIDLAIKAIFAVSECLPKIDINDEPLEDEDDGVVDFRAEENEIASIEEDAQDNDRWSPVAPGNPLPSVTPKTDDEEE